MNRRITLFALIAVAAASMVLVRGAVPATTSGIVLLVGANESQRVVNWYASANTGQVVQVAPTSELQDGEFPNGASTYPAVVAANNVNGGFSGHAILDSLKEDTVYSYRVGGDGAWSQAYQFQTRKFEGDFDFLFFGDPQIGASGNVPKDQAGWVDTLHVALSANPNAELLVSGGDQVETAGTETQWTAFLAPDELRSYPWVATIGNHDVGSKAYEQHLWTPNTDRSLSHYTTGANRSGGDYWFIYKGVLFIDLNSNAFTTSAQAGVDADEAHIGFITDVVAQHGAEARYTVLVYHHSIYSPGDHANDGDNKERRKDFPTAFSNLGVDLVLQGHDHSYSRSYLIEAGVKQKPSEQPGANSVFKGPGGVVYVTGNSASGSKYYAISAPNLGADPLYGPDPLNPSSHWANSVQNQENVRNYVKVVVRNNLLSVENIRSGTCAAPNAAVELRQETTCGPNLGASPALPVGSLVDKVFIVQDADAQVARGGLVRDRRTGTFAQQLTITNNSSTLIAGPVGLWLEGLSANATLANASGAGNYIVVPGTAAGIAAGSSATVTLQFLNPTNAAISYTTHVQAAAPAP